MPVLISEVWIMVWFYMSCAAEMFFSLLSFCTLDQLQNVFRLIFQFEGMKRILTRSICSEHTLQPLLPNKRTNPHETTTSHLNRCDWKIHYYLSTKHKNLASKGSFPALNDIHSKLTIFQHSRLKEVIHILQECPEAQRLVEVKTRIYNTTTWTHT